MDGRKLAPSTGASRENFESPRTIYTFVRNKNTKKEMAKYCDNNLTHILSFYQYIAAFSPNFSLYLMVTMSSIHFVLPAQ